MRKWNKLPSIMWTKCGDLISKVQCDKQQQEGSSSTTHYRAFICQLKSPNSMIILTRIGFFFFFGLLINNVRYNCDRTNLEEVFIGMEE